MDSTLPSVEPASFPEDFWTDSPVHVSRLSDAEFCRKHPYFLEHLEKMRYNKLWNRNMKMQYKKVLQSRASYSLPLPEPVNLACFEYRDVMAIFTKMHHRVFGRSFRLCRAVNRILNENIAKFRIRIRKGQIIGKASTVLGNNSTILGFVRVNYNDETRDSDGDNTVDINDPSSIIPFTFDDQCYTTNEPFLHDILWQMKWPFTNLTISVDNKSRLEPKSWMVGATGCWINDSKEFLLENWKMVTKLKPKELSYEVDRLRIPLSELLHSAEQLYVSHLPNNGIAQIVQKWRLEAWSYKSRWITVDKHEDKSVLERITADCFTFELNRNNVIFIPNPDKASYLILVEENIFNETGQKIKEYCSLLLSIRYVADLVEREDAFSEGFAPIDYSAYAGDIADIVDPLKFCQLLESYGPRRR